MHNKRKPGRPVIGTGRKKMWNTRLDPLVLEYLKAQRNASQVVHDAITRTASFKQWKESK